MATGSAWNLENPLKPWAYFDPNAKRRIPFDWTAWLAAIGSTYASHTIIVDPGLEVVSSGEALGVITPVIQKSLSGTLAANKKYAVTCRIVAANEEIDDQTLYLKIFER